MVAARFGQLPCVDLRRGGASQSCVSEELLCQGWALVPEELGRTSFPSSTFPKVKASWAARRPGKRERSVQPPGGACLAPLSAGTVRVSAREASTGPLTNTAFKQFLRKYSSPSRVMLPARRWDVSGPLRGPWGQHLCKKGRRWPRGVRECAGVKCFHLGLGERSHRSSTAAYGQQVVEGWEAGGTFGTLPYGEREQQRSESRACRAR